MIELPESITLAKQIKCTVSDKTIASVLPPAKPHKFCWFTGDPSDYNDSMKGCRVLDTRAFGFYVDILLDNGLSLCINDGVNVRYVTAEFEQNNYQLLITFTDGTALVFTVAMYGGIYLHDDSFDNEYYRKSLNSVSPADDAFSAYFFRAFEDCKKNISAKAFLATEQRFPGIGNGTLQDILFTAGIHPKRKLSALSSNDIDALLTAIRTVLSDMISEGGRDTEKDLFGQTGGYATKMSKKTMSAGCSVCGSEIVKENYLGGSVYYCPNCQQL